MALPYDASQAVAHLSQADPDLGRLIEGVGAYGLQPRPIDHPFEALTRSIIYQQLSGKAAGTIYGRFRDLFPGDDHPSPREVLAMADDTLRGAGISRPKLRALNDLAARTLDGTVPTFDQLLDMPDDAIVDRLTQVKGVGVWTAQMFLMFWMGRPDVLPATDLGVRRGFQRAYGLETMPEPEALLAHGERWRPYRTVASWYLWRAVDTDF